MQKIQRALEKIDEISVIYSLVQLAKVATDTGQAGQSPTIDFYRCWVVHTSLDRNKSLARFFAEWDGIISDIQNNKGILHATNRSQEVLNFVHLFTEIESFGIKLEDKQKYLFINALMKNLVDTPLRWSNGDNVDEFRFTFEEARKASDSTYFCHMQIHLKNAYWFDGPELHY